MSSSYSSLDWVLSHWVHLSVHSLDLVVFICVYFVFFSYCIYVVLLSAQWGGPNGIEAWSLRLLFLQCFATVGWVFWPIKPVLDMTYNVFGGTLNLAQLLNLQNYVLRSLEVMIHYYQVGKLITVLPLCVLEATNTWLQRFMSSNLKFRFVFRFVRLAWKRWPACETWIPRT